MVPQTNMIKHFKHLQINQFDLKKRNVIYGKKEPCHIKINTRWLLVWELFVPIKDYQIPEQSSYLGVHLDMAWFLLTTDDIPFLQIKLISL